MVTSLPLGICSPGTGEVIFIILVLKRGFVGLALIMEIGASAFEEKLDFNWEARGEEEGEGAGRERFKLS